MLLRCAAGAGGCLCLMPSPRGVGGSAAGPSLPSLRRCPLVDGLHCWSGARGTCGVWTAAGVLGLSCFISWNFCVSSAFQPFLQPESCAAVWTGCAAQCLCCTAGVYVGQYVCYLMQGRLMKQPHFLALLRVVLAGPAISHRFRAAGGRVPI